MTGYIGPGRSVPFISQIDDVEDPQWQRKFCGIVAVYMVLSYWWKRRSIPQQPSLEHVSKYGLKIDGYSDETGWVHAKLCEVARYYKHPAMARSWLLRDNDLIIMRNQNRISGLNELKYYRQQVEHEFLLTLRQELRRNVPVILSVKPKFGNNITNHLIVVTAIAEDNSHVLVHDPETAAEQAHQEIRLPHLLQYCNFNAIFIYDEAVRS